MRPTNYSTLSAAFEAAADDPAPPNCCLQTTRDLLDNAVIEFVATVIGLYGAIYTPHTDNDPLAQLIPGLAILVVFVGLKDQAYFCPDGSFMVTTVLLWAGAYTDAKGVTNRADVGVRWAAQALAFVVVYFALVRPHLGTLSGATFTQHLGGEMLHFNEFVATFIECTATAFCVMPLLVPIAATKASSRKFPAKTESVPPTAASVFLAGMSLAIVHMVMERLFRATMNPFAYAMHCEILSPSSLCSQTQFWTVCCTQLCALAAACAYAYMYMPPPKVLRIIFART